MTRRGRGEGTVLRDGDGWIARVDLEPGPDGKRRRMKRRARTKTAALAALKELRNEVDHLPNPTGLRRTVSDAIDSFLSVQPKANRATKTIEMEEWRASVIASGLGEKTIGKLSVNDCDAFLRNAAEGEFGIRPIGTGALRRIRSLLVMVLRNEIRMGNLIRNVADLSVMPIDGRAYDDQANDDDGDSSGSARRTLSHHEYRRLWRVARNPLVVLVDLCGRNGLRPSEARGLRWECVDFEEQTLIVNRQMSSKDVLTRTKTKRSRRTIQFDELTVECLTIWRDQQEAKRKDSGDRRSGNAPDLVISTRYGTPIQRSNLSRMLTAACEEATVERIVPYELRHTAITFQMESGNETWRVADWAGTSERMIEEIYRHRLSRVSELGSVQIPALDQ